VQIHGKGASTCSSDTVFLSAGIGTLFSFTIIAIITDGNVVVGNSSASKLWYTDTADRPVKRLQRSLQHTFPSWRVSLPSDSNCPLTATKNVVGRYMNGIDITRVCSVSATSRLASGEFIHAEQSQGARLQENYAGWAQAVMNSFDTSCADGMVPHFPSNLCVDAPERLLLDQDSPDFSSRTKWYILSMLNLM